MCFFLEYITPFLIICNPKALADSDHSCLPKVFRHINYDSIKRDINLKALVDFLQSCLFKVFRQRNDYSLSET